MLVAAEAVSTESQWRSGRRWLRSIGNQDRRSLQSLDAGSHLIPATPRFFLVMWSLRMGTRVCTLIAKLRRHMACSFLNAFSFRWMLPSQSITIIATSLQPVPNAATAAVPFQMVALGQVTEMLLERVATSAGQFDNFADRDAPVLPREFHDPKRQLG